jgi:hypothetical protein
MRQARRADSCENGGTAIPGCVSSPLRQPPGPASPARVPHTQDRLAQTAIADAPTPGRYLPLHIHSLSNGSATKATAQTCLCYAAAITSISTRASLGRRTACTVERAGGAAVK